MERDNRLRCFGTDGVRGKIGCAPITPDFILKLGWATGCVMARHGSRRFIIGKDTRLSGYMLESALEAGLAAAGASVALTGPMPTPAIAYLTRTFRAEAGIVISASHNPYDDNGIKFFSPDGMKLSHSMEAAIEALLMGPMQCVKAAELGRASRIVDAAGRYIEFCKSCFPNALSLKGLKIVVDCAHGATYHIAPMIFHELGAEVIAIGCEPNGMNINHQCGATDVHPLRQRVLLENADLGLAFDGDGDRLIMIDQRGNRVDGDQIIYLIAREYLRQGKLQGGVVGTWMSNIGLELALKRLGIAFKRTHIGDRCVLEEMQRLHWRLGAENSGHIILLDKTTTGDGVVAALQVVAAMVRNRLSLLELCQGIDLLPQILLNVPVEDAAMRLQDVRVKRKVEEVEHQLMQRGRVMVRKSGTEPLIRIMLEGEEPQLITQLAHEIADVVRVTA